MQGGGEPNTRFTKENKMKKLFAMVFVLTFSHIVAAKQATEIGNLVYSYNSCSRSPVEGKRP